MFAFWLFVIAMALFYNPDKWYLFTVFFSNWTPPAFRSKYCFRISRHFPRLDRSRITLSIKRFNSQLFATWRAGKGPIKHFPHRGFLESALLFQCTVFLWPLECFAPIQQLPADSVSACICIHACRSVQWGSQLAAVEWGKAFKQSQEFCWLALSRKPLWLSRCELKWCIS